MKNCHVIGGFNKGFIIWQSSGNTFVDNISSGNANNGFSLADGDSNNTLMGNQATGNAHQGFGIGGGSDSNVLSGNIASANGSGFWISDSSNNRLSNNTATNHPGDGFQVNGGGSGNVLSGNVATGNHYFGSGLFFGASGNTLEGNTASANDENGFAVGNEPDVLGGLAMRASCAAPSSSAHPNAPPRTRPRSPRALDVRADPYAPETGRLAALANPVVFLSRERVICLVCGGMA